MSNNVDSKRLTLSQWDKTTLYLSIAVIVALSWWYLIDMASDMNMSNAAMDSMNTSPLSSLQHWTPQTFLMMFVMWTVMMAGMMLPSAVRTIMIYARVARQTKISIIPATFFFISGYLIVWAGFSLAATGAQWWLNQHALLSPMMVSTSTLFGAGLLIAAGIYQLTPIKETCLKHCQSPLDFISKHFRNGYSGAARMGVHHGLFCLGCCWLLMGLLFLAGVMNLLWILAIAIYVLFEKLFPANPHTVGISGTLMVLFGIYLLVFNG